MASSDPTEPTSRTLFRGGGFTRSGINAVTVIVALNILVFLYQDTLGGGAKLVAFIQNFALSFDGLRTGHWWQLITHMFLHGGMAPVLMRLVHIGLNMFIVYGVGNVLLEERGTLHFIGLYLFSGICGGLLQVILYPHDPLLGASGAAFGLMTAFAAMRANELLHVIILFIPARLSGASFTNSIILSCVILGLIDIASPVGIPMISQIGHFAHLGGALGGLLYARVFGFLPRTLTREDLLKQRTANDARLAQQASEPQTPQ